MSAIEESTLQKAESQSRTQSRQPASRETARQRNLATKKLLESWLTDDSGYDEDTWPELKRALQVNRAAAGAEDLFCD